MTMSGIQEIGWWLAGKALAADAPAKGAPQGCEQMSGMLLPILLMFVIIYFMIIRPQQKQQKRHRQMLSELTKGDRIITSSGILGSITGITDAVVTLEIAKNVHIRMLRSSIAGKQPTEGEKMPEQPAAPEGGK